MARIDDLVSDAIKAAGPKPADDAVQSEKNPWVGRLSNNLALAFAQELRERGMVETRPAAPGDLGLSGAERRLAGGLGAKRVDVTWATEESGLILACSIKTIMFRDAKSGNFQKNLTNRRGDMTVEAMTLHRRFPFAVISGWLFLDAQAAADDTLRRRSTFENAVHRLRLFTGRPDPSGREEQFERLYLLLLDANPFAPSVTPYNVADPTTSVPLEDAFSELVELVGERNFDLYEAADGVIRKTG